MQLEFHQIELKYGKLRIGDKKTTARLLSSLAEYGQQVPVTVVSSEVEGKYVLIDGYKRVHALKKIGCDVLEALVLPMTEAEALCLSYRQQRQKRKTAIEDGWLIRELVENHRFSQSRVAKKLGHGKSWVSRRLALVQELPEEAEDLVHRGKLCAHGAMRALVPLARANYGDCKKLIKGIKDAGLSSRQMERLYRAWLVANKHNGPQFF